MLEIAALRIEAGAKRVSMATLHAGNGARREGDDPPALWGLSRSTSPGPPCAMRHAIPVGPAIKP
jgi:hypothetical protein